MPARFALTDQKDLRPEGLSYSIDTANRFLA